jgi:hypothetical protein
VSVNLCLKVITDRQEPANPPRINLTLWRILQVLIFSMTSLDKRSRSGASSSSAFRRSRDWYIAKISALSGSRTTFVYGWGRGADAVASSQSNLRGEPVEDKYAAVAYDTSSVVMPEGTI